ncbi:MAG: Fe-S cluster assembly protein SufD [Symploca sp. SIO2B6]|nr:Fe-S cluster assembly protein SufD [Symploca sp. SIO2B6]
MSIQVSPKPEVSYLSRLLEQFPQQLPASSTQSLIQLRERATTWIQEQTFPSRRDEEWRFTDLSPLLEMQFQAVKTLDIASLNFEITPLTLPEAVESRLVFINGVYAPQLSSVAAITEGVFVGNIAALPSQYEARLNNYLGKQKGASEVFTALNTAGLNDVAVVWVAKDTIIETPLHLLFISSTDEIPFICQPRCLVVAEAGAKLTLVEHYGTDEWNCPNLPVNQPYFNNQVTEIWVEENAQVNHIRNQRESMEAFHIGKTAVSQARNSSYTCNAISLGAKLSRHNLEIFQKGEGTETVLNGLTMISGQQLADTHSTIALAHPHGSANQLHKCIVDNHAHSVFNGKVLVPQAAQLTNANQLNRNLLLSPKARVNTKPQLEITADNVKCTHGATVGQLDPEEVFYLQSRGLNEADARNLLIDAFAAEIIGRIPLASLRQRLVQCVACRTS